MQSSKAGECVVQLCAWITMASAVTDWQLLSLQGTVSGRPVYTEALLGRGDALRLCNL